MKKCFSMLVVVFMLTPQVFAQSAVKYNKELDGFDYPFDVETFKFNSQNQELNMRYMDVGAKDAEKVIVLLHGKNFAGYYWEQVTQDLLKRPRSF
ncbi:MAG: hypothetical protein NWQ54_02380 [Paraglaciecola sp.]|uniref:hypothetical protein n=1 Tax=Paraglaciecola sp. TaxID=1920173 RepID=UPI00273D490C|nr:hypothetical protein [Paraglaciecola sp.]MDP5032388.1 hypothetical protein [Paraglaciecola sp.]MDP5129701.1 hypothetical protein [Paraglaciecola sp.]